VIFWHAFLVERENEKKKEKKKISLISRRSLSPSDFSAAYDSKCLFVSLSLPLIFLHRRAIGFISSRGAPLPRCGAPARAPLLAAATRLLWCAPLLHHRTPLVAPAPLHGLHPWPLSIVPGRSQAPSSSFGFSLPSTFLAARALVRAHPCRAPSASLSCPRSPRSRAVAQLTLSHGRAKPLPPWPAVVSPCAASSQFNLELLRLSLSVVPLLTVNPPRPSLPVPAVAGCRRSSLHRVCSNVVDSSMVLVIKLRFIDSLPSVRSCPTIDVVVVRLHVVCGNIVVFPSCAPPRSLPRHHPLSQHRIDDLRFSPLCSHLARCCSSTHQLDAELKKAPVRRH
jgi:hypothetical protein